MIYRTTHLADAVLAYVNFLHLENEEQAILNQYCNGRENGYALSFGNKKAAWSEFRRSDNIVVYTGEHGDFEMSNIPDAKTYKAAKFFDYNEAYNAALYIIDFLGA